MIKIGIISRYYASTNYGGLLQAYALCRYLNYMPDVYAEQISYDSSKNSSIKICFEKFKESSLEEKTRKICRKIKNSLFSELAKVVFQQVITQRGNAIKAFRDSIPHSDEVYDDGTIKQINENYDIFITGSDRVWNPQKIEEPFYLTFVDNRLKVSYAASLAGNVLTKEQKNKLSQFLEKIDAISVREVQMVEVLQELTTKDVRWVVDPTLLLSEDVWNEKCLERQINEKYIFCYFLGGDKINRELAKQYATAKGLVLVTVPYASDRIYLCDVLFGDYRIKDCSVEKFLSLIKHSEYVFTDSFHATIFSVIFNKEVFVLERKELKGSGTRLQSLTDLFQISDHYCKENEHQKMEYLEKLNRIDYSCISDKLVKLQRESKDYLKCLINGVKDKDDL